MRNNIGIIDCETGGLDEEENPITQFAITIIDPSTFEEIESYSTFVKPYNDLVVTKAALAASRVSMKEINEGVEAKQLFKQLVVLFKKHKLPGRIGDLILAGHNFGFDLKFLKYLFNLFGSDLYDHVDPFYYDTQRLYSHLEAHLKGSEKLKYNLTNLCERYNVQLTSAHGAPADVKSTKELLIKYLKTKRDAPEASSEGERKQGKKSRGDFFFEI